MLRSGLENRGRPGIGMLVWQVGRLTAGRLSLTLISQLGFLTGNPRRQVEGGNDLTEGQTKDVQAEDEEGSQQNGAGHGGNSNCNVGRYKAGPVPS
jgi:hypothetical protein